METRTWISAAFADMGIDVLPSKTNFIFAKPNTISAEEMFTKLKQQGIYVRWFDKPRIKDYLRISIGTKKEMQTLLNAVRAMV